MLEKVINRINENISVHKELVKLYRHMGLENFADLYESKIIKDTCRYLWISRYEKSVFHEEIKESKIVPKSFFDNDSVPEGSKKEYVKNFLYIEINELKKAKKIYEQVYDELLDQGEISTACKVYDLVEANAMDMRDMSILLERCKSIDFNLNYLQEIDLVI